jgi:NAD(P)-dependent dehydrogenase (short-subunit alcohol dehydrogenase family)
MKTRDFRDKAVYLVGGSSGIGLETGKLMSAEGAHVAVFARNEEGLKRAVEEMTDCKRSDSQRFLWRSMDVCEDDAVHSVIDQVADEFGPPDVVIICAGRAIPHYFEDITYAMFDDTMKTNLYGTWSVIAAVLPHMKERGGYLVTTSSLAGFVGVFGYTDYSASKFALMGLTETLRSEFMRYDIGVSVLCPPDTDTPGFAEENKTKPPETKALSETVKLMSAHDVAKVLLKGMKRGKPVIIPGFGGKFMFYAKRFVPRWVEWVLNRTVRKVQREHRSAG